MVWNKITQWFEKHFNPKVKVDGVIETQPDPRDWKWDSNKFNNLSGSELEKDIDLRPLIRKLTYQGKYESCTGHSRALGVWLSIKTLFGGSFSFDLSPLYLWHIGQEEHDWQGTNKGVDMRYSFKALFKHGFVPEHIYPYSGNYFRKIPDEVRLFGQAVSKKFLKDFGYYLLKPRQIKEVLHKNQPVFCGIRLDAQATKKGNKYVEPVESIRNPILHEVLIVGKEGEYYIFANWWGPRFGQKGYLFIHKNYVEKYAYHMIALYYKKELVR